MHTRLLAISAAAVASVTAYDNGVHWAAKPPRGWSTWCTDDVCGLLDFCNETEVLSVADAMVAQGLPALNYSLILLDDCWASTVRDANGDLQPDATRFPSGIDYLVEQVHARSLYLGLYTCAGERTCKNNRTGSGGHYEEDAKWFARHNVDMVRKTVFRVRHARARGSPLLVLRAVPCTCLHSTPTCRRADQDGQLRAPGHAAGRVLRQL